MHKLLDLARRVEEAEGPSRELDAEIACIIGKPLGNVSHWLHGPDISYRPTAHGYYVAVIPVDGQQDRLAEAFASKEFTGSLDAAATLVPEGWRIYSADFSVEGLFGWTLKGPFAPDDDDEMFVVFEWGNASTPALALTAASLRARAALEQADER